MSHVKRKPCATEGCPNLIVAGVICANCMEAHRKSALDRMIEEMEAVRKELNLSDTWGCLDPNCEICS